MSPNRDVLVLTGVPPVTKTELLELVANGEHSGVEFNGDLIDNRDLVKDVLEHVGMGIPRKIIRGMREHNGTEPDLIDDEQFTVRLWKAGSDSGAEA